VCGDSYVVVMERGCLSLGASGTQSYGNIGQGVTPKPIGTTAESTDFVPINVTDAPTTDLNNTASILSGPTSYAKLVISELGKV
nr:hypothetical protein [Tanacetum cinerariifolium]